MKIILSSNSAWNLWNFRSNLIKKILNNNNEVVLVAPEDKYSNFLKEIGCRFINLKIDNKGTSIVNDIILFKNFYKILSSEKPDFIFCFTPKPNIYGSLAANFCKTKVVNTITGLGTSFMEEGLLKQLVKFLYKISLKKSKKVFFQNQSDLDLFLKFNILKYKKTGLIPGSGVDLNFFKPIPMENKENHKLTMLFLGRLIYDKGIRELVEAARIVKKDYPNIRFNLLGFKNVNNRTAISEKKIYQWQKEGIINYLDPVEDVRPYLNQSDCVILPSYREGISKSLLEAAAMERPIICSNVPGCKEIVEDGINGIICEPKNFTSLANAIFKIINIGFNNRILFGKAGRRKVEKEYSEDKVISFYLKEISNTNV